MNNFLILGLPRSRTAWLANFLCYDGLTCTHEGLNGCNTIEEYRNKFVDNMGDANTGLAMFNFQRYFSDFKIIVIDRDIDSAVKFSIENFGLDLTLSMKAIQKKLEVIPGLHIPYDEINDKLEGIWDYLSPNQFNEKRAEMLIKLDVQVRDVQDYDKKAMLEILKNEKPSTT